MRADSERANHPQISRDGSLVSCVLTAGPRIVPGSLEFLSDCTTILHISQAFRAIDTGYTLL